MSTSITTKPPVAPAAREIPSIADRTRAEVSGWRTGLARVLAMRYWILGILAAGFGVVAGGRGDWNVFVVAGKAMVGPDGLHVFERHGDIQTGPVSLLLAWMVAPTPRNGFVACVVCSAALGLVAIRSIERARLFDDPCDPDAAALASLLGGIVVVFWWAKLGGYGHLDDAIVLAAAAVSMLKIKHGRPFVAALLIGLSLGVKPWAIIFLPLTWVGSGPLRARLRAPGVALAVGAAVWMPFVVRADTLRSLHSTVKVAADSVIRIFGVSDSNLPSWLRTAQLSGALVLAAAAMWRRGPVGALWVAVALRVATDPGTWSYYTVGFVLGALAWDLCSGARILPVATLAASLLLLPAWLIPWADLRAIERLLACVAAIVIVFWTAPGRAAVSERVRPADRSRPMSGQRVGG